MTFPRRKAPTCLNRQIWNPVVSPAVARGLLNSEEGEVGQVSGNIVGMTDRPAGEDGSGFGTGKILRPGDTCWQTVRADRFAVIVDAADYFAIAREVMLQAERSIFLIGWDFDLRIKLVPDACGDGAPQELGRFLRHIVRSNPNLRIWILKWDMAVLYSFQRGVIGLFAPQMASLQRIRLRFDSTHPWTSAHHQKIAVIDDSLAFCGGIDMTTDRWDTRDHLPGDERRRRPDGEISGPWHDTAAMVDGEAARALGDLARDRWLRATGRRLRPGPGTRDLWPEGVSTNLRNVEVGIARTMPVYNGRPEVREVERLSIAAIRAARRTIYLESQYFASSQICEEIARRLREPDGPEVLVINPLETEGWLEEATMGTARDLCLREIAEADLHGRFGMFYPVNDDRMPVYVHAKVLIIDDSLVRVGSSNVNNRSMGFDSECDLAVEVRSEGEREAIRAIRDDLVAEHLGVEPAAVTEAMARENSLLAVVRALAQERGRSLLPIPIREVSEAAEALARSHLADPERAGYSENRVAHFAKRVALSLPPSGWAALGVAGVGLLAWSRWRRRQGDATDDSRRGNF